MLHGISQSSPFWRVFATPSKEMKQPTFDSRSDPASVYARRQISRRPKHRSKEAGVFGFYSQRPFERVLGHRGHDLPSDPYGLEAPRFNARSEWTSAETFHLHAALAVLTHRSAKTPCDLTKGNSWIRMMRLSSENCYNPSRGIVALALRRDSGVVISGFGLFGLPEPAIIPTCRGLQSGWSLWIGGASAGSVTLSREAKTHIGP